MFRQLTFAVVVRSSPTELRDVGKGGDSNWVSTDSKGSIRRALHVLAGHCSLLEDHHTPCSGTGLIYYFFTCFQLKQVEPFDLIICT